MDQEQWIMVTSVRHVLWKKIAIKGNNKSDNWIISQIEYELNGVIGV